jgi:drug/metabolite transporter (DMT)-like permease
MLEGLFILLFAQFAGSVIPVSTKFGVQYFSPLFFVFLRFFVASLLLLPFFLLHKKQKLFHFDYLKIMLLSLFLFLNVTFFTIAIVHTTVLVSQLLYTATPVVVGILGHWFFGERLTKHKVIGLVIAASGVCFLLLQSASKQENLTFGTPFGNILILLGVLGYSGYLLYARTLGSSKKYTSVQLSFYTFVFIGLYLLLVNVLYGLIFPSPIFLSSFSPVAFWSIVAVGVGNSISYGLLQLGIKKTDSFTASLFQYLGPFFAGILAIPLLHEKLSVELIIGGILIIAGVFYATSYDRLKRHLVRY